MSAMFSFLEWLGAALQLSCSESIIEGWTTESYCWFSIYTTSALGKTAAQYVAPVWA